LVDKQEEIIKKKQEEFDNLILNDMSYRYKIIKKIIDESLDYIEEEGVDEHLFKEDLLVRRFQYE
jgi:predicted nicotinamide N-methyase